MTGFFEITNLDGIPIYLNAASIVSAWPYDSETTAIQTQALRNGNGEIIYANEDYVTVKAKIDHS